MQPEPANLPIKARRNAYLDGLLALAIVAGTVAIIIAALTAAGTEAKGVVFGKAEPTRARGPQVTTA